MGKPLTIDFDGCPSGLQKTPIIPSDPLVEPLNLSPYVVTQEDGSNSLELIIQGAHCAGCIGKIEKGIAEFEDVSEVRMNLSTLRLKVNWHGDNLNAKTIVEKLSHLGFGAAPYSDSQAQSQSQSELKSLLLAIAVAGFATMNVMLLSIAVWSGGSEMTAATHTLFHWISALIALPTVAYAGRPFFGSAWKALKNKHSNMDVPISLALILACSLSVYETVKGNPDTYFDAAVMLLFLLLIGRYLDARLRLKTGEAARRLAALQVTSATRILNSGNIETVPASAILPGDILLIPAGQRIPVDCQIIEGVSDIDMQIATGETAQKPFGPGDTLYSGTINLTSPLTVKAIAVYSDSFLSEIMTLVEAGEQDKGKFVRIADRAARSYVPIVHSVALLTFIGWLIAGAELRVASLNAIAVLIITCPCALGLAVPAVHIVAAGKLFKHGVFVRSGDALERLAKTKSVIFDKTGTLTTGKFTLLNENSLSRENLTAAAALTQHSNHPLSRALSHFTVKTEVADIKELPGQGISGQINGEAAKFGSAKFVGAALLATGETEAWLKLGNNAPILFQFTDRPRADAAATVKALTSQNLTVELLSGDGKDATEKAARSLDIKRWRGGVSPKEKMQLITQRKVEERFPLMVGDGINDAPALAAANASASLATASDISRSAADIILQGDKLSGLPMAIRVARSAQSRVVENLSLAILYNALAIPLAIFGFVNPLIAALAMSGSSLLVTLNALRVARP